MKRMLALLTGGTVGSAVRGGSATPSEGARNRLEELLSAFFGEREFDLVLREPWGSPGYDSSDLGPRHWITLTRILSEEMEKGLDGAIILHGTDTMAYTSAWLSVALGSVPIPVVLTGSQLTLDYTPEDVLVNLRGAAQVLCAGHPGVWIYFNWKLLPGNRAHKARATHPDAYVPVNGIPVYFSPEWLKDPQGTDAPPRASWSPSPETARLLALPDRDDPLEGALGWHFCAPGCPGNFSGKERVLGLIGLGSGNAPQNVLQACVDRFRIGPKPLVLGCSQAEGDRKNPAAYKKVGIASLVDEGFSVWSQGEYPLEFVHALATFALLGAPEDPASVLDRYLRRSPAP